MIGKVRGLKVDQGNDSSPRGEIVELSSVLIIKRGVNTGSNQPCTSRFKTLGHDNRLLKGDSTLLHTSMPTGSG